MRKLTEKIVRAPEEEPLLSELRKEDVRFHVAIMTAAKNALMKKEILRLHLINRVVASPAPVGPDPVLARSERDKRRGAVLLSHQEIYEAIRRSDVAAAKSAMERHIQDIIDNTLRAMSRSESGALARELTEEELSYTA
jgi:DNA-binding GntR family transcriptional regulator